MHPSCSAALRRTALATTTGTVAALLVAAGLGASPGAAAVPARVGDPGPNRQVVLTKPAEVKQLGTATSKTYRMPSGGMRTVIKATPASASSKTVAAKVTSWNDGAPTCQLDSAVASANCAGTTFTVGKGGSVQREVMAFDLSALYRNVIVTEAGLGLHVSSTANSTADAVTGQVVTKAWDTSATWTKATASTVWANAGGDFTAAPAFTIGNAAAAGDYFPRMTQTVADWVSGKTANNGLLIKANEGVTNTLTLASANDPSSAPVLTVDYDYATSPSPAAKYFTQSLDDRLGLSVNLANGNLRLAATDLTVPGVNGLDLDVVRSWSSLRAATSREFANAWQLDDTEAGIYSQNDGVTVMLPGGTPGKFLASGSGYTTPPGWNADLTRSGTTWVLKYRRTGEVWTFTDVPGASWEATLTSRRDRNGNTIAFTYNTAATVGDNSWPVLTGITDTFGNTVAVHQNAGKITDKITDASGRHSDYTFSGGKLTAVADVAAKTTTYSYDANGYVSEIVTPKGNYTRFTYGPDGRVDTVRRVTNVGAGTGPTWQFTYDAYAGSPLLGQTTVTDPNGHALVYTRDTANRITKVRDANGHDQSTSWTPNNDQATLTDGLAAVRNLTWDASTGNLMKSQAPTAAPGVPGNATTYGYADAAHPYQTSQVTTPQGNHLGYTYNTPGNATRTSNDRTTANHYDRTYNGDGTPASQSDSAGVATAYGYTGHRLTSIDNPSATGDEAFTYDSVGRVRTHTDGKGQVTTYTYNTIDRLTAIAFNGSGTAAFTYDDDGNLATRTDASGSYSFTFDPLNRVTQKNFPGSGSSAVTYDGAGNVLTYTDAGGTVTYGYDNADNVTKLAEPGGSCTGTISKCTTFGYDANNNRTSTTYPNGVVEAITYDPSGRAKTIISTKGAATLAGLTYTYTSTGGADRALLQSVKNTVTNLTTSYSYDVNDELTSATVKNAGGTTTDSWTYTYDGNGNRLTSQRLGSSTITSTFTNADEIATTGSTTWTQDNNSNLTAGTNGFTATYNDRDQTTSITQSGGSATSQGYADIGQHERVSSGSTAFLTGILGLQSETTGSVTRRYTRDPYGNLISVRDGSNTYYYLTDNIGSVVGLTNSSGAVAQAFSYDPYGQVLTTAVTTDTRFKFAGGEYDNATKLYHFGQRYYDPAQGRWTQRDVLDGGFLEGPQASNRTAYAGGNPTNYIDPTGLSVVNKIVGVTKIISGQALLVGSVGGAALACVGTGGLGCAVGATLGVAGVTGGAALEYDGAEQFLE